MTITTMGSEYWPQSAEGRILCLLLAIYAFAIFGYVTAAIASFLVGKENRQRPPAEPGIAEIQAELARIRETLDRLRGT